MSRRLAVSRGVRHGILPGIPRNRRDHRCEAVCCTPARTVYNCVGPDGAELGTDRDHPLSAGERYPCDSMTDVEPLNLVVVDDDQEVRTALGRLLRSMGHEVHAFASAEDYEARPAAADCLIVDLRLPGINGFELLERLRLRGSSIPVVFITGDGGPSPSDAMEHSGTATLAKPFDDTELIAAITGAVSARASVQ